MAKIIIAIEYEPNLKHYPSDIKNVVAAMEFDVAQIEDGNADIGLLLENDMTLLGVVDDSWEFER